MYVSNSPLSTHSPIHTVVSDDSSRNIFRLQEKCHPRENLKGDQTVLIQLLSREDGDIFLSPSINGNKEELQASTKGENSTLTTGCDESCTLRRSIISFSSDEEDVSCDNYDMTTPLDYRKDWSQEVKNTLQMLHASGTLLLDDNEDNYLKCGSIASFDIDLDTRYELECQPLSEWIEDIEDIIW